MTNYLDQMLNKTASQQPSALSATDKNEQPAKTPKQDDTIVIDKKKLAYGAAAAAGAAAIALGGVLVHRKLSTKFVSETLADGCKMIKKMYKGSVIETRAIDSEGFLVQVEKGIKQIGDGSRLVKKVVRYLHDGSKSSVAKDVVHKADGSYCLKELVEYVKGKAHRVMNDFDIKHDGKIRIGKLIKFQKDGKTIDAVADELSAASRNACVVAKKVTQYGQQGATVRENVMLGPIFR